MRKELFSPFDELVMHETNAQWEMAESCGDETIPGSVMTLDQNVIDEFGTALGVTYEVDEELWLVDKERSRDAHRWELDPASADDWDERHKR